MLEQLKTLLGSNGRIGFISAGTALALATTIELILQFVRIDKMIENAENMTINIEKRGNVTTSEADSLRIMATNAERIAVLNRAKNLATVVLGVHLATLALVPVDAFNFNGHNLWLAWAIQSGGAIATIFNVILAAQIQSFGDIKLVSLSLSSVVTQLLANMLMLAWILRVRINN